ncbi:MAG TPA: carbohydrate kinase family protein [Candidatus Paceibacterota bacterium]|nr:carbohydrate kinase family protein [Candidatus Paceibacterota bacterium]HMP19075.1 carbohydrate kinase family protein [Candidatus Paceibacterota bacterium]HMP85425.1 carbohydrate kinase family protein [Candidatus Paceibacterota bacterium]
MFSNSKKEKQLDFVGVGDVVIDTFIELIDAWIETDNPEKQKELCMKFGHKIPYKNETVVLATGNAPNAAHTAMKLGLSVGVVTNIGDDFNGSQILLGLSQNQIDTKYVTIHKKHKSNHNYILRYREERTILIHHNEYEYSFPDINPAPKWIYLSSLAHNSLKHHHEIANYLKKNPNTKLAFQPGTFQIKLGYENISDLYKMTEIFFCNKEEAQSILKTKSTDIKELLKNIKDLGPKIVVITDGPDGAYTFDGTEFLHGPMYPDPAPAVDRTGAGDSFSATFATAIALGKSVSEALMWGPINSMSVVQYVGAQEGHLTKEQLLEYLKNAPNYYKVKKI